MEKTKTISPEQLLANALPDAIIALDRQANLLWWNQAANALFAIDDAEQAHIKELLTDPDFQFPFNSKTTHPIELKLPHNPEKSIYVTFVH